MSGVAVIRWLLVNDAAITAIVPAARVIAGLLPINTVLPAIEVTQISGVPSNFIKTNEKPKVHTDRVQVSVLFKGPEGTPAGAGYPGVKSLLALVLKACPSQRGLINGVLVDSIQPDTVGPDISDAVAAIYSQTRDFRVIWVEP